MIKGQISNSPLQSWLQSLPPDEEEEMLRAVLRSPARLITNSKGSDMEDVGDLLSVDSFAAEQEVLRTLDGMPVYDLGCGIVTPLGRFIRTNLPSSSLVGVDIDPKNGELRRRIVEQWERRRIIAKKVSEGYRLGRVLTPTTAAFHYFWGPSSKYPPVHKESFHLDEFVEGDFNNLDMPAQSAGVVVTNWVTQDISSATVRWGFDYRLSSEIDRILVKGGVWVNSDFDKALNIVYQKPR